jgi:hypothetical protein
MVSLKALRLSEKIIYSTVRIEYITVRIEYSTVRIIYSTVRIEYISFMEAQVLSSNSPVYLEYYWRYRIL